MDQRLYFGWAASVLGADADHAGEDDDGNKAAQEKPGGEKGDIWTFWFFVSRCRWLGRKFVEILGSKYLSAYLHIASVRASVLCSSVF